MNEKYYDHNGLKYYEIANNLQPLVLIHAQGVDGSSYTNVAKQLSKKFHIYSIDCYGHGGSRHDPATYNIKSISEAVIDFIEHVIQNKVWLVGHSSGGLIAAFIAAKTDLCDKLILEDPPFFASQGERRKKTFNMWIYQQYATIIICRASKKILSFITSLTNTRGTFFPKNHGIRSELNSLKWQLHTEKSILTRI